MARPSWTNVAATDIDQDSPGKTGTVFGAINDNTAAARVTTYGVDIAEDTSTSVTFETVLGSTHYLWIEDVGDYTGIARKITLGVRVKVSAGTGSFRLYDVGSSTAGDTITSTSTSYEAKDLTLDIDASWKGTTRELRLEFHSDNVANTAYLEAPNSVTGRVEY